MRYLKRKLFQWLVGDKLNKLAEYLEDEIAGIKDELAGDIESKADQTDIDQLEMEIQHLNEMCEELVETAA